MAAGTISHLAELRQERDRTRTRLIEIELQIAAMLSTHGLDIRAEIAEAEERGDWIRAAQLRASCVSSSSAAGAQ